MESRINKLLDTKMLKVSKRKPQKQSAKKEPKPTDEKADRLAVKKSSLHKK